MNDLPGPLPQRIGDRERDQAAEFLRDHLAEGRLDQEEFDERLTTALTARTQADLDPLFVDLPSPKPGHLQPTPPPAAPVAVSPWLSADLVRRPFPPQPVRVRPAVGLAAASVLLWPLMIVLMILSNGHAMPILVLPFLLPWILGHGQRRGPYRR